MLDFSTACVCDHAAVSDCVLWRLNMCTCTYRCSPSQSCGRSHRATCPPVTLLPVAALDAPSAGGMAPPPPPDRQARPRARPASLPTTTPSAGTAPDASAAPSSHRARGRPLAVTPGRRSAPDARQGGGWSAAAVTPAPGQPATTAAVTAAAVTVAAAATAAAAAMAEATPARRPGQLGRTSVGCCGVGGDGRVPAAATRGRPHQWQELTPLRVRGCRMGAT